MRIGSGKQLFSILPGGSSHRARMHTGQRFDSRPAPPVSMMEPMAGPRILIVTPEITYLPPGMGNMAERMSAKAGGLADVSASLVSALYDLGADIHVALPNYRRMFNMDVFNLHSEELRRYGRKLSK